MKLKFEYSPKKDANGYYLMLPNRKQKRFKTKKSFDRWFANAQNELNGVFKILLLQYPVFSDFYIDLLIRSNVQIGGRLSFIQKIHAETNIISNIFGLIPRRGFYEAYIDLYRLLSFYDGLLEVYNTEYMVFSDRYSLSKIRMIKQLLELQKYKLNQL